MADLDNFIAAVLTPVSEDSPHQKLAMRTVRHEAWHRAYINTITYEALLDLAHCLDNPASPEFVPVIIGPSRGECVRLHREAVLRQLLTPAVRKMDLDWKHRRIKMFERSPDLSSIELAIAEDEAFLATKKRRLA